MARSSKYIKLKQNFDFKLKKASTDYLKKNVTQLKHTNPKKAYSILKRMCSPEENDSNSFSLKNHVDQNLSIQQSVDKI